MKVPLGFSLARLSSTGPGDKRPALMRNCHPRCEGLEMPTFPIAQTLEAALDDHAPRVRTAHEAEARIGQAVFLATEEAPGAFASPAEAEAAYPELYGSGRFELYWREEAWRVAVRFWRPAAPAPVARALAGALKAPLGYARTPEEARELLGQPAERVSELFPTLYATRSRLMNRWGGRVSAGLAVVSEREGKLAVSLTYWRPAPPPGLAAQLTPAERSELAERIAAPLRGAEPQSPLDVGLFEQVAPENPDIVLAEEGDGRFRGE
jgi:hypothetical protein